MNFLSVLYAKAGIIVDGVTTLNNTATALTPATNDNSTNIATTGYVKNQNYYPYPTGTTAQYVRGDGSLATFTQTGGGGSSVSYYLNGSVSQGTIGGNAYYEMSKNAIIGTNADFSINADGYVAQFVTDAGDPALLSIPGGNWNFEMWFSASSGGGTPSFYVELYKYDGTTLTLIASGSAAPESITGGTSTDLYITALAVPTTTLTLTDRLAVRVYVNHSGRTITLHTQNGHLCQVITSFSTGLTALNGLTAQVQNFAVGAGGSDFNISSVIDTHTFNLPTASATKRGALSSIDWSAFDAKVDFGDLSATSPLNYNGSGVFSIAQSSTSTNGYLSSTDWNTFNNKQNALTLTTTGTSGAATLVGGVLNIPQYQAVLTNPVTGTGTTGYITKWVSGSAVGNSIIIESGGGIGIGMSPSYTLDVNGTARIGTALTINGTSEASTALTIRQSASLAIALAMSNRNQNHTWGFVVDTAVVDDKNFGIYNITNSNFPLVINATTNAATFSSSVTASSLIKSGGTSTQYLMADGSTSTLTNPITGTGTTNYLPKFTGTSALGNSNLINDANGQLGLGVTPSPWSSSLVRAFQIGNLGASISSYTALNTSNPWMFMDNNAYNDGTNDKYILSKAAARYVQVLNEHRWLNAPTGTAGDTISFTQAMTLDANGRLAVGSTSPTTRFEVYGGHNDTTARLYSTGNNSTLNASLDMWASEPGVSYDGSGIGNNVNGSPFYGRRNSALGQSYIRFISGQIIFYTGTTTANPYLTIAASGVSTFTSSVNATSFTANNRTTLTSGGLYDNATNGNDIGFGFGAGVIISTNGVGTYSAQNLGNSTYPWYSAYFVSTITAGGNYLIANASATKKGYTFNSPNSNWGVQTSGIYFNPADAVNATPTFTINLWNGTFGTAGYGGFTDVLTINGAGGAATFTSSVTAGGNFELNSATTGLKSNFYDTNFYASSASYWNVTTAAAATYGALLFLQGYGGTTKGYVYWDSSGFGLLNNVGGWSVRANYSSSYGGLLNGSWEASGTFTATNFIVPGGTSAQFLKADGSVDSNTYATTAALAGYLPLAGGTLTGNLNGTTSLFSTSVATTSHGTSAKWITSQTANGNFIPYSFESDYGNHSWGIIARFRINQANADRPSIQFSNASTDNRWNVGYCFNDDQFRITQNMGYRNDNTTTDSWGTERFRIDTFGTLYANGNVILDAGNYNTYAAALYHTHDLGRYSLAAPANIDALTTTNFRNILFGNTSNTWNISTARWNTTPTALPGMNSYGTMLAWSGSDTQGFIATDYTTANITVGGGNGSNINWTALLVHSGNIGSQSVNYATSAGSANAVYLGGNPNFSITDNSWAGAVGYHGYSYTGSNYRFGFSSTGGYIDVYTDGNFYAGIDSTGSNNLVLHAGNYSSYALPLTGGTLTGALNGTQFNANANRGLYVNSGGYSYAELNSTGDNWAWFRLSNNASVTWDIASKNGGNLEFRPGGGDSNAIIMSSAGRVSSVAWTTTGRNYSYEWIEFPNSSGLFSPINSAHFYPNNGSYGGWKVEGARNGWAGLEFGALSNGSVSLMINPASNSSGFYNTTYGWQFNWNSGTLYVGKNTYGGGTQAVVLDEVNVGSYAVKTLATITGNIDSDYGECFVTFDPIPSGTPPLASPNIRTINVGNSYSRRTQLAFDYASDKAYFRRRTEVGWFTWREFIHSGNIGSQSVAYATTAGALTSMLISQFTNNSGYITSSALADYLPLAGGTITGDLIVNNKVYVGTHGCYFQEVLIGGVYELQVVDSAGNRTVLS